MKICIFGNKKTTENLILYLYKRNIIIDHIIILNEESSKLIEISGYGDSLKKIANDNKIKIFKARSYNLAKKNDYQFFINKKFDLGLCAGWQRLIPNKILKSFKHGVYGWHGSGLEFPNGRGRSPLNWSLRLGLNQIYHNCFKYSPNADEGLIFDTKIFEIKNTDYIKDLQKKALRHICQSSVKLINQISRNNLSLRNQPNHPFIYFPKLNEKSGELFPELMSRKYAIQIIRSCSNPFPGAYVIVENTKYRIWKAQIVKNKFLVSEGNKIIKKYKNSLYLKMIDGWILINSYTIE